MSLKPGTIDDRKVEICLTILLIIAALAVRCYGLMDNGLTWDEPVTVNAGVGTIVAITQFNFNGSIWAMNFEHPPIGKYIYGIAIWLLNGSQTDYTGYIIAKLVSVLLGAAACLLVYFIGQKLFNKSVGFAAAFILAFIPVFVANTQIAALDSPIAFFFTLTMYLFILAVKNNSKLYYCASAVSLGLLIGVKLNGLLILPVLAAFYLLHRYEYLTKNKLKSANVPKIKGKKSAIQEENSSLQTIKAYIPPAGFAVFCVITILTVFLLWPWLWFGTVSRLNMTFSHWAYTPQEYFLGSLGQAPVYYYIIYFIVTTPLLLFIPLALGVYRAIRSKDVYKYAILLWLIIPFAYSFSSLKQGGMRYLIMIYPAVALLCGYGLYEIAEWIGKMNFVPTIKKAMLPALCAITVIYLIICLASVQPYYLDYYNSLAGGYQNIHDSRSFNFGWWGEGIYGAEKYISDVGGSNTTSLVITMPDDPTNRIYDLGPKYLQSNLSDSKVLSYVQNVLQLNDLNSTDYHWNSNNNTWKTDYIITNFYAEEYYNITVNHARFKEVYSSNVQGVPLVKVYKVL